ncbi:MAG TPA: hypothetical protein VJS12_09465 [Steroidobacteraceae bacterium]|nr:hypothetical protein [Steroidobacteraceae bacterium]
MNIRIMLGTGLLLTVGTAVAGTFLYGQGAPAATQIVQPALSDATNVTPEMLAAWVADSSDNYVAPKVPI